MTTINAGVTIKHDMTLDELVAELTKTAPGNAKVSGGVTKGDRPWDADEYRIHLRWTD